MITPASARERKAISAMIQPPGPLLCGVGGSCGGFANCVVGSVVAVLSRGGEGVNGTFIWLHGGCVPELAGWFMAPGFVVPVPAVLVTPASGVAAGCEVDVGAWSMLLLLASIVGLPA
jgi:hypothetical protein